MDSKKFKKTALNLNVSSTTASTAAEDLDEEITFEKLLPTICYNFNCSHSVVVRKEVRKDDSIRILKKSVAPVIYQKNKSLLDVPNAGLEKTAISDDSSSDTVQNYLNNPNKITVSAIYQNGHLIELCINKTSQLPQLVMKAIGLLVPYLKYLNKISIRRSHINAHTIYELQTIQSNSHLTEIVLEDARVSEGPYSILLEHDIRNLTLCRCEIDDKICEKIAKKLHISEETKQKLQTLNLSSNCISDVGARHLADALRTNRTLRSLNMADNRITDEGVKCIMDVLSEFHVMDDELKAKRQRHFTYLRKRLELVSDLQKSVDPKKSEDVEPCSSTDKVSKSTTLSAASNEIADKLSADSIQAEMIADEMIGPFEDSFSKANTVIKANRVYSRGNMALASLNLSYNKLSYLSLKIIDDVLVYQEANKRSHESSLVRILIEGNSLPDTCTEMVHITNIITNNLNKLSLRSSVSNKSCSYTSKGRNNQGSNEQSVP